MDNLTTNSLFPLILVFSYVLFWLVVSEVLSRTKKLRKLDARKLLHIMVGNVVLFIPLFTDHFIITAIPVIFIFLNFCMTPYSPIKQLHLDTFEAGHALGTVYYAISLSILVVVAYDFSNYPWIIVASFFPLAYGDGLAAVVGSRATSGFLHSIGGKKSLIGSWVFIWASFLSVVIGLFFLQYITNSSATLEFILLVAIVVAIVAAYVEFMSPKGTDNFFIPVFLLFFLFITKDSLLSSSQFINLTVFSIGFLFALSFAIIGYTTRILTLDGSLGGFFMGMIIMGLGGYTLGIGLLIFFIIGTLATKVGKSQKKYVVFEKGSVRRDSLQALAKAGFATIIALLTVFFDHSVYLLMIFIATLGASLADTMGTEIGIMSKSPPRPILALWRKAMKGESGAISIIGSIAAFISAVVFTLIMYIGLLFDPSINQPLPDYALLIIPLASTLGMFLDSFFGATIQDQRKCTI